LCEVQRLGLQKETWNTVTGSNKWAWKIIWGLSRFY